MYSFPSLDQPTVPCLVLPVASWPPYRFLRQKAKCYGMPTSWRIFPVCASSSLAFRMMYSACKLNKQGDNIQPWHTSFPIQNQSVVITLVLTVASWRVYMFLRRQGRWSGISISWRIFQFAVIHTVKDFSTVNETVVYVFFCNSLAFSMIHQMLAIWSLVPLPFLNPAWTSGSSQFVYCWSLAWRILTITLLAHEMSAGLR